MALTLHYHPLSSYCQKALTALYEHDTPFTPRLVDFSNKSEREEFLRLWPIGKFPVLQDGARNETVPESTIIVEYLEQYYPGRTKLIPAEPARARETRARDRFYDLHVHNLMQQIVGDRLRPADKRDPFGVEQAKRKIRTAYGVIDNDMANRTWAAGDTFTLADCAAAPALYYANLVVPFAGHEHVAAYFDRLMARPSFAQVVKEAEPYRHMFPTE